MDRFREPDTYMFCPECGGQYINKSACPDCKVALVDYERMEEIVAEREVGEGEI